MNRSEKWDKEESELDNCECDYIKENFLEVFHFGNIGKGLYYNNCEDLK